MLFFCGKMATLESNIIVGLEFHTFPEVEEAIRQYELANYVDLYVRSSRTVQAMQKRAPKRTFSANIQMAEVDYACIHGGRNYSSKSKGARPKQR